MRPQLNSGAPSDNPPGADAVQYSEPLLPSAYEGYRAAADRPLHYCKDEPDRYFNERGKEVQDDTVPLTVLESGGEKR